MEDMKQFLKNSLKKVESRSTCSVIPSSDPCSLIPDPSARRGSALLIVLGMLAFMVVSAVSFSMFMRQSRVPSSYLRRTASSRYLLKAALANAIARLDGQFASCQQIGNASLGDSPDSGYCEGVYDDPYPGVGSSQNGDDSYHSRNGDYWEKRVFCPFGLVGTREDQNQVPHYRTVSTLTLEGLAYLPPAIINEVRVYSRLTRTAMWRNLAFDAGRYAFCAVDVSDCFDLNRMSAGMRRSSAPGERVNLSSLFPQNGGSLDAILQKCSNFIGLNPSGGKIPFTSVADFNIVAGKGNLFAPFAGYIGTSGQGIYNMGQAQSVSNALFITDTYFPPTNTVGTVKRFDLSSDDPRNQPFSSYSATANFLDTAKSQTDLCKVLMKNIGGVGLACLYDYLDENDRPISFVVPTVETVPMVCGIGLAHNSRFAPRVQADGGGLEGGERDQPYISSHPNDPTKYRYKWKAQKYSLRQLLSSNMKLTGVAAYPFKRIAARGDSLRDGSFTGEALVRVFMGPASIRSRLAADSPLAINGTGDWNDGVKDGVVSIKCTLSGLSFASDVKTTQDAVKQFTADINAPSVDMPVFWSVWEAQGVKDPDDASKITWTDLSDDAYYSLDGIKADARALVPYDADGRVAAWWKGANAGSAPTAGGPAAPQAVTPGTDPYVPHVLVWVRIMHNGNTVDIVPARIEDDGIWGGSAFNAQGMAGKFGDGTPVLEFRGDAGRAFTYDATIVQKLDGQADTFPLWAQLYAVDPRYNYAPENWFAMAGNGDAKPGDWLTAIGAETADGLLGTNGRDPDIFMFTSDQEHLQSVGELAFLPWVQEMDGSGDFFENDYLNGCDFDGTDFTGWPVNKKSRIFPGGKFNKNDMDRFASRRFMWRTYTAVDHGDGWDAIYGMRDGGTPVEISSGTGDFRVNPFSPDTRALMAALKDTPADWSFASDDETRNPSYTKAASERASWAFCEENDKAKMSDEELLDLSYEMHDRFMEYIDAKCFVPPWEYPFDNMLAWYDGNKCGDEQIELFNVELDNPLHGVDRKFLHGFWRECFQNRQQLFLVFLRAEPLTVGGAGEGSLASAQLGARGVALVWRDPQPPARGTRPPRTNLTRPDAFKQLFDTSGPHRTRVLFYHQFD